MRLLYDGWLFECVVLTCLSLFLLLLLLFSCSFCLTVVLLWCKYFIVLLLLKYCTMMYRMNDNEKKIISVFSPFSLSIFFLYFIAAFLVSYPTDYEDTGAYWRSWYETPNFEHDVRDLFEELKPFYEQLHAFVRRRLKQQYGDSVFPASGHIPAHLLGQCAASAPSLQAHRVGHG